MSWVLHWSDSYLFNDRLLHVKFFDDEFCGTSSSEGNVHHFCSEDSYHWQCRQSLAIAVNVVAAAGDVLIAVILFTAIYKSRTGFLKRVHVPDLPDQLTNALLRLDNTVPKPVSYSNAHTLTRRSSLIVLRKILFAVNTGLMTRWMTATQSSIVTLSDSPPFSLCAVASMTSVSIRTCIHIYSFTPLPQIIISENSFVYLGFFFCLAARAYTGGHNLRLP